MLIDGPDVDLDEIAAAHGWEIKSYGACREDACVPLPPDADGRTFAERMGMAIVEDHGLLAIGPESGGNWLASTQLPDITLTDRHGAEVGLRSLLGTRLVITSWAPWCGCFMDLPVWQSLRDELIADGIEVVTVALDSTGAALPILENSEPTHPALIDSQHQLVAGLGFVNVPMSVWVDESGRIVRPAEPAWPGRAVWYENDTQPLLDDMRKQVDDDWVKDMFDEASNIATDADAYVARLRDWASMGADSAYVLTDEEVLERSGTRSLDASTAAAHFEIAQRLRQLGKVDDARAHLRQAHALDPDNWSYKRQSWFQEDALQRPTEHYDSDFVTDIRRVGATNYYRSSAGVTGKASESGEQ